VLVALERAPSSADRPHERSPQGPGTHVSLVAVEHISHAAECATADVGGRPHVPPEADE
jgi:hypothetical protein